MSGAQLGPWTRRERKGALRETTKRERQTLPIFRSNGGAQVPSNLVGLERLNKLLYTQRFSTCVLYRPRPCTGNGQGRHDLSIHGQPLVHTHVFTVQNKL